MIVVLLLVALRLATFSVGAQETTQPEQLPLPTVQAFSGSPLLLEVVLHDPDRQISRISFTTDTSTQVYNLPPDVDRTPLVLRVSPFLTSGLHDLNVTVHGAHGTTRSSTIHLAFVDFVWGRDNMSFGNNAEYESVIGTFGEVLAEWLEARFGAVDEADTVLLVDYMYSLFGSNTGRCYAFAGTEVRYWRWPELLPSYYDHAHDIRANVARSQREMNYLQFDIVFDHFIAGPGSQQIGRAMALDEIKEQARAVAARVVAGEPVAVGFAGPELHHSMLVFGVIHDPVRQTVDLLVANNWKSDEKLNIHSRDAEIIRLSLADDHAGPRIEWRYEDGTRSRQIDRLFAVEVRREYNHSPVLLDDLRERLRAAFLSEGFARIVVEGAAGARLTDGERFTGQVGRRRTEELPGVWYERVGRTYRLAYPAGTNLELEIVDDAGARVLAVLPMKTAPGIAAFVHRTEKPPEGERVTRRIAF